MKIHGNHCKSMKIIPFRVDFFWGFGTSEYTFLGEPDAGEGKLIIKLFLGFQACTFSGFPKKQGILEV